MPLYNATVNYTPYDFKMVAMYQENDSGEYESIDSVPSSGYALNEEMSYCEVNDTKDSNIQIEYENGQINFLGMTTKGTKCYLYFDIYDPVLKEMLLAYYPTILTRTNFSSTVTTATTGTIYKSANESQYDNDGEVYYFAGAPTDNWILFAGYYWRIVRINGNGTVRIIYQGTSANSGGTATGSGMYNYGNASYYVGFKYTVDEQHGAETNSSILNTLNDWSTSSGLDAYLSYIDSNAGFCNDREMASGYTWSSTPSTTIRYIAYERLQANKSPSLKCGEEDKFNVPVGLITADEIAYAGGVYGEDNTSYYLYINSLYWTMSPYDFNGVGAGMFLVDSSGALNGDSIYAYTVPRVRPVINLRADIGITGGNGTASSPFTVN